MKKFVFAFGMICIILVACGGQKYTPTMAPSATVFITTDPTLTAAPSATSVSTSTSTSTPTKISPTQPHLTPTFTPFPLYQNKKVVFIYYISGNHSDWDDFFDPPSGNIITKMVLYDDGQMILVGKDKTYKQKFLSSDEMGQFLSKLETLGLFSLESNQEHDLTDKLYDFGKDFKEVADGLRYCISVNATQSIDLCAHGEYHEFLIPKMTNIFHYLDEFIPAGTTTYDPDRILLSVQESIDSSIDIPPAVPWDERFPSLEISSPIKYPNFNPNPIIYVDGVMAKDIYLFLLLKNMRTDMAVVSQNNTKYILWIRILLPHEKVMNAYQ